MEFYNVEGVGCVASVIGLLIQTDSLTEKAPKLSYTRVCIEFNVRDNFPNEIELEIDDGVIVIVWAKYV